MWGCVRLLWENYVGLESEWSLHAFVGWWSQLTGCEESGATNEDLSHQRTNVFWLASMVNQDVHLSWQCFNDSGFWRTVSTMSQKNRFRHAAQEITICLGSEINGYSQGLAPTIFNFPMLRLQWLQSKLRSRPRSASGLEFVRWDQPATSLRLGLTGKA